MNLTELITHQIEWEAKRGINNPNHNLDRTQTELDEAQEETDPYKRLFEMVDMLIILSGGMGKLLDELQLPVDTIDDMLRAKLDINQIKYEEEAFYGITTSWAVTRCRHYWQYPDQFEGNDYY